MGFYKSLPKSDNGLKTNSVAAGTAKVNSIKLLSDEQTPSGCNVPFVQKTNKTAVSGDTTRTYTGNSIFTGRCNGYYSNGWNVDAYTLADTLNIAENGAGFYNNRIVTLNYDVRTMDANYSKLSIWGYTSTYDYTSKVSNGRATEFHKIETAYRLISIRANNGDNPVYTGGVVEFDTKTADLNASTGPNGATNAYNGFMEFYGGKTIKAHFRQKDGSLKTYEVVLATGEATEL